MPRAATADRGLPARSLTYRSISQTWLTCGNGRSSGAGMTWMVRVVMRPCPAVGLAVRDRDLIPGQRIEGIEQGLAVLLDRQHELPAGLVDELGGGPHRVESIGGDDLAVQVHLPQYLRGHRHFVRLGPDLGLRGDD